uniref:MD-2-related lipid-recognition domain-containing protein n=1 Tax=Parascaris univalens TaxID=6257 RepID=A0A915B2I6_PARUN
MIKWNCKYLYMQALRRLMLRTLIVFVISLRLGSTCNSAEYFPNATAFNLHHYSCMHELGNGTLMIASMAISSTAERHYPIDVNRIVSLIMTMNNTGAEVRQLLLDIEVFAWERLDNGQCGWEKLPTFGFTDDLDGCEMIECPLEEGFRKDFPMNVDIRDGASFLDSGKLYQLKMVIKNGDRPKSVRLADYVPPLLGCAVIQAALL